MKKRILGLILSLCICATASLASCGSRSDSGSSNDSTSSSGSSVSDSGSASTSDSSATDSQPSGGNAGATIESSGNVKVVWTSTADAQGDIDLFTAKFKVASGAPAGLSKVEIGGNIIVSDASFQKVTVESVAGGVDVGGSDAAANVPAGAAIITETKGANAGDEVEITVKLANVDYCTTLDFNLLFDAEVLEFVEITPSSTLDACGQLVYNVM